MRQYDDDPANPYDRNGLLKDGHTVHVRFRDAARARGDDDEEERRRGKVTMYDPSGRLAAVYHHDNAFLDSGGAVVAARPGFITTADSQRIRDAAYQQSKQEMQDAWKTPPPVVPQPTTHTDAKPHDPSKPISMVDAQKIRDAAYAQSVHELANAWRGK